MLKTSLKSLALVAGLLGTGGLMAQTCNTNAWGVDLGAGQGVAGTPTPGSPAASISRYSGRCGLLSDAPADFVRDGSPLNEPTYIARFYVRPNASGAVLFQGTEDGAGSPNIQVAQNASTLVISGRGLTGGTAVNITPGAWYSVELNYTAGAAGTLAYTVQGANGASPAGTGTLTGNTATFNIDQANLGWISGGTTGTVNTDAFESRRTQPIGRLCKGDANGDGSRNSGDGTAIRIEFLSAGATLATGQPDCNEDGLVNSGDNTCVRLIFLSGNGACPPV